MAITAAHSLANFAEKRGINPDNIVPKMDEPDVFSVEAADVAMQAIKDGVARKPYTWEEVYQIAKKDIDYSRSMAALLSKEGFVADPPAEMLEEALEYTVKFIEGK